MKKILNLALLILAIGLCPRANAFYNPSTGRWLSRDPVNELGVNILVKSQSAFSLNEEKNPYGFTCNNPILLYDKDGRVIPIVIGGGVLVIGTGEAVAATFGLSLAACLASAPCAKAIQDAISQSLTSLWEACFARRLKTCTVRCQVVRIGADNDVIGWVTGTGTGYTTREACRAAEAAARNSTAPGTRTKHCQ